MTPRTVERTSNHSAPSRTHLESAQTRPSNGSGHPPAWGASSPVINSSAIDEQASFLHFVRQHRQLASKLLLSP